MTTLKCSTCQLDKPIECFSKEKTTKRGRAYMCRQCVSAYNHSKTAHRKLVWENWYYTSGGKESTKTQKKKYFKPGTTQWIGHQMRTELNHCLIKHAKGRSYKRILDLVGAPDRQTLINYLDTTTPAGMTFKTNYGRSKQLCVDHIKPLVSFDLTNEAQLKEAFHLSNLRLITHRANQSKGSRTEL